jgi:hypothetical protein
MREVLDENTDQLEGLDEIPGEWELRLALVRLEQLQRDEETMKRRKQMVVATYEQELAGIARQRDELRRSIEGYLVTHGGEKVRFPDVGTAYLTSTDPKIEVVDKAAFEAALGDLYTKPVFDMTAAKGYALDRALEGELVAGVEFVPAGKTLGIRRA